MRILDGASLAALVLCGSVIEIAVGTPSAFAQSASVYSFAIPAKPLLSALADYTAATGVQVVRNGGSAVTGMSGAVAGRLTAEEAATRLLSGSGLTYRFTSPRTLLVEAAGGDVGSVAPDGSIVLDSVTLAGGETARGPVAGIVATRSATATKTDTPLKEPALS